MVRRAKWRRNSTLRLGASESLKSARNCRIRDEFNANLLAPKKRAAKQNRKPPTKASRQWQQQKIHWRKIVFGKQKQNRISFRGERLFRCAARRSKTEGRSARASNARAVRRLFAYARNSFLAPANFKARSSNKHKAKRVWIH